MPLDVRDARALHDQVPVIDLHADTPKLMHRIGFDIVGGYLEGGMRALEEHPELVAQTERITAPALAERLGSPERPLVAILGGAKVSDKIKIIEHLLTKVDALLIGGAMAYTFLRAEGKPTGDSLVEPDRVELAATVLARAKERGVALHLPIDHLVELAAYDVRTSTELEDLARTQARVYALRPGVRA